MPASRAVVVGGGVFGVTGARALRARGWEVVLVDPGPLPHPRAASTDLSKVVRMEYGADEALTDLAAAARDGWLAWNARWREEGVPPRYHDTGVLMITRQPLRAGDFELESLGMLERRGFTPERVDPDWLARRFPAWAGSGFVDGLFHANGGYAESGAVIAALVDWARREGVECRVGQPVDDVLDGGRGVAGVRLADGAILEGDVVVVAAGAWTDALLGGDTAIAPTGHPVFHFAPPAPHDFTPDRFPTFTADITRTGYYGFPLHRDGVVKIARHGAGRPLAADAPREVSADETDACRAFLASTLPALADAPLVGTRLCLYADTPGGDFWIGRHPDRQDVTVASGGSGHGFKFAPVLGDLVADMVEGTRGPLADRCAVPPRDRHGGREAARYAGRD